MDIKLVWIWMLSNQEKNKLRETRWLLAGEVSAESRDSAILLLLINLVQVPREQSGDGMPRNDPFGKGGVLIDYLRRRRCYGLEGGVLLFRCCFLSGGYI